MDIFDIVFLIIGIFLLIGTSLVIFRYKRKYPEKELKYKSSLVIIFFGILLIMGALTGLIRFMGLLILVFGPIFQFYYVRKHPEVKEYLEVKEYREVKKYQEVYKKYPISTIWRIFRILRNIMTFCFIFVILVILVLVFFSLT